MVGDFLAFHSFITPSVLIIIYYLGAFAIVPIIWIVIHNEKVLKKLQNYTKSRYIILCMLLCFELAWRMVMEFFIAYFDMHAYLHELVEHTIR
jgi:glucan phosphoethanolaminetransferase (alkaline phosphatase superfamily)